MEHSRKFEFKNSEDAQYVFNKFLDLLISTRACVGCACFTGMKGRIKNKYCTRKHKHVDPLGYCDEYVGDIQDVLTPISKRLEKMKK